MGLFSQGFSGQKGAGGTHDGPTGYIAPVKNVAIPNRGEFTFSAYLTIGTWLDSRELALLFSHSENVFTLVFRASLVTALLRFPSFAGRKRHAR